MGLEAVAHLPAAGLPFATLKRVEAARALAVKPKLLLLDEPAGGLNHEEVAVLGALIRTIRDRLGTTILLVEHHMSLVMEVSDKVRGARLRQAHRRGHARPRCSETPKSSRPISGSSVGAILEVEKLEAFYGRTQALHGVSFAMEEGGITTVLGANGAGKTTMLRAISAMVKTRGSIRFGGTPIEAKATEQIVAMGIAHVPEGRGTFVDLTVEENLRIGMYARRDTRHAARDMERVLELFPILGQRRRQHAGTLSGGEQQMLAVARALMLGPRLLLLDEPSLGLAPLVVREIFRILRTINQESGSASCSWSRTPPSPSTSPTTCSCSRPAGWCCRAPPTSSRRTTPSAGPISATEERMDIFVQQVMSGLATGASTRAWRWRW